MPEPTIDSVQMELNAAMVICERPKPFNEDTTAFIVGGWFLLNSRHGWEILEVTNDSGGVKTVHFSETLRGLSDFLRGIIYLHRDKRRRDADYDTPSDKELLN